jgi:hypothetical protein
MRASLKRRARVVGNYCSCRWSRGPFEGTSNLAKILAALGSWAYFTWLASDRSPRPLARQRSFISFPHSHSSDCMSSSSSNPNVSFSQFQDLFDSALREYNQKTGKDIATEPLTTRLLRCDSSDAVLGILQEQAHAFNQFRDGDWKIKLMRRLKPTVDILLGLSTSGVFGEGFGLVRLTKLTYPL